MGESKKVVQFSSDLNNGGWPVGLNSDDGREGELWIWAVGVASLKTNLREGAAAVDVSNVAYLF